MNGAIVHGRRRTAGKDKPNMLDVAARRTQGRANVNRPPPSGLINQNGEKSRCENVARPIVMPPMRTISNFPFSNVRISSGSSKRFRTVSSIAIFSQHNVHHAESRQFLASRTLNVFHSPIQSGNAKCVRSPGSLSKPSLPHPYKHLIRGRKALNRSRQIRIRTSHSRKHRPD